MMTDPSSSEHAKNHVQSLISENGLVHTNMAMQSVRKRDIMTALWTSFCQGIANPISTLWPNTSSSSPFNYVNPQKDTMNMNMDDNNPQSSMIYLVDIRWLKPYHEIHTLILEHKVTQMLESNVFQTPLIVDANTGTILDGHYRYHMAQVLQLSVLPVILIQYLTDPYIVMQEKMRKNEVLEMASSEKVCSSMVSKHRYDHRVPRIAISFDILRQRPMSTIRRYYPNNDSNENHDDLRPIFPKKWWTNVQSLTVQTLKRVFWNRITQWTWRLTSGTSTLDVVHRPIRVRTLDGFRAIRDRDPSSAFCRQRPVTLDDLLTKDPTFFAARISDPTSYFYKYRLEAERSIAVQRQSVVLLPIDSLHEHEEVVSWERVEGLKRATLKWNAYVEPLLVDRNSGAILDGHHRYNVGKVLQLKRIPAVLVDYLEDDSITVEVWPDCGRDQLSKEEVISMSLSAHVFPPKTSRHVFSDSLPPISIPLERLRLEHDE